MTNKKLFILTVIVSISGLTQGMLLPLIAIIFERNGVSSTQNGLHATSIYIGVFLASIFLEGMLRKIGYKSLIIIGAVLVILSLSLFPIIQNMTFWFILRLIIGVGDNMLHFSTQSWLTESTPRHKIGKVISIYGLSFSLGFMAGPLLAKLYDFHFALPFIVSALFTLAASMLVFLLKAEFPVNNGSDITLKNTAVNFSKVIKTSWIAFLFPMLYGILEASLNSNFPVYALKNGLSLNEIILILPAFSLGSILFQVPIGALSDKMNRYHLMAVLTLFGGVLFFLSEWFSSSAMILTMFFFVAGIFIGSMYSLGVTFMTDITPKYLLPAGNLMCGIFFSIGSIAGPVLGGMTIQLSHNKMFFTYIAAVLFIISIITFLKSKKSDNSHFTYE